MRYIFRLAVAVQNYAYYFGMNFIVADAVENSATRFFENVRVIQIVFFVEPRAKLDYNRYFYAVFARAL